MKPTELTMCDVLNQEVATAIRLIKKLKELEGEIVPNITDTSTLIAYFDSPTSMIRFRAITSESTAHIPREEYPFSSLYYGYDDATLAITAVIARHRAVWDELSSLHPLYPSPQDLGSWVWDEFPEDLNYTLTSIYEVPDYSSSRVIPQLAASAGHVSFRMTSTRLGQDLHSIHTPLWRIREHERFTHGIYVPLPDEFARLLPQSILNDHFPHIATKDSNQGMVAYTQSPTAGMLDRQQVQKPGRYIRQHCPNLTDEQVKQAAATLIGSLTADFYHTKDAHEIRRIYMDGPQSCMCAEGRFDHLIVDGEQYHPTMIYAHPENNLELVYLEVSGHIGARALVNTKKKTYPRIYSGDSVAGAGRRMGHYLESLGYSQCDYALSGEKLLRVSPDANPNAIICPYIDNSNIGVGVYDDYLLVGDDDHEANYETGCLIDYDCKSEIDWYCVDCDEGYSDDDDRYTNEFEEAICSSCADSRIEAYSLSMDTIIYVSNDEDLYDSEHSSHSRYADALHLGGMRPSFFGLAELNNDLYNASFQGALAPIGKVIEHYDFGNVLIADLDEFELIDIDGIACPKDECFVLDGELKHDPDFYPGDEDTVKFDPPPFSIYPELDHYMTIPEESATKEAV